MGATKFVFDSRLLVGSCWHVQGWLIWKHTIFALWVEVTTELSKVNKIQGQQIFRNEKGFVELWDFGEIMKMALVHS